MNAEIRCNEKKIGLGTLGLSGKYCNVDERLARDILDSLNEVRFEFVDSASAYNEHGYSIDELLLKTPSFNEVDVFYKIGANPEANTLSGLKREFIRAHNLYSNRLRGVLLHRTAIDLIGEQRRFFEYIRENYSGILLGISVFSNAAFSTYAEMINPDLVQVPINIIDFKRNSEILKSAKERGMITQARSCLASGLLSGKYGEEDMNRFSDAIRGRYSFGPRERAVYQSRMAAVKTIKEYVEHLRHSEKIELSMPVFSYSVIANLDFIDHIIVGGTSRGQLFENASLFKFPARIFNEILDLIDGWQADVL